ncbi:MAG: hypothetical protein HZB16_07940 [Armatimonadetes bacterium]|nr:hypothetical protein [Armatimonadota bacterium]
MRRTCAAALDLYVRHGLSDGIGIHGCVVAVLALALGRSATLLTFNRRHFSLVAGLAVLEPNDRLA